MRFRVVALVVVLGAAATSAGCGADDASPGAEPTGSSSSSCPEPKYALRYYTDPGAEASDGRSGAVAIVDADGHSAHPGGDWLTGAPSFSPDGKSLAVAWFESTDEGRNTAIAILGTAANDRRIIAGTDRGEYPSWSPDGSTIAYARNDYRAGAREIRVMDATSGANNHAIAAKGDDGTLVVSPAWSPDGKQIAFLVVDLFSGQTSVWVINRDGTDVLEIADVGHFDLVTWRPDGTALLLGSPGGAAVLDLATREVSVVSEVAGAAIWSGDGNQVLYSRPLNSGGKHRLATGTIEGTHLRHDQDVPRIPPQEGFPQGEGIAMSCRS